MSHTPKNQENISESAQKQLEALRRRIDSLDTILLHALAERMQTVREVGELKHRYDIPPLQPQRWQEVLQHKREIAIELHLKPEACDGFVRTNSQWSLKH